MYLCWKHTFSTKFNFWCIFYHFLKFWLTFSTFGWLSQLLTHFLIHSELLAFYLNIRHSFWSYCHRGWHTLSTFTLLSKFLKDWFTLHDVIIAQFCLPLSWNQSNTGLVYIKKIGLDWFWDTRITNMAIETNLDPCILNNIVFN